MPSQSDWIAFLIEEASTSKDIMIFITTIVISVIVAFASLPLSNIYIEIAKLIVIFLLYATFFISLSLKSKERKAYHELLEKIMTWEITTPQDILAEYNKIPKRKNKIL
ncbi:MAG: hypothetical protein V1726_06415 [Methanobacteriota archaeon]